MASSSEENQPSSSQFRAPQSAQPRSLFGGPSSDVGSLPSSQPEPPRPSIFGGVSSQNVASDPPETEDNADVMDDADSEYEDDDFDMILRERPLEAHYDSDGDSFQGDDGHAKKRKQNLAFQTHPSFPIRSKRLSSAEPTSQTYVLDRGLDLPPDVERPNRWAGAAKTYSNLIEGERGIYESMNTARSRDLAAHLYNAYAIRNGVKRLSEPGNEQDDIDPIYLPKRWVAWPLPSAMVPRVDEAVYRQLGSETLRMPPDLRPSAELEESIMAKMMKTAKERFMAREWDEDEVRTGRAYSPDKTDNPDNPDNPDETKDSNEDKKDEDTTALRESRPVVQADDSTSRQHLRPLSRNVISQLDQVLTGLHHSMKNRYHGDTTSDESSAMDTDDERSRSRPGHKSGRKSQSRGRKRTRKNSDTPEMPSGRALTMRSSTGLDTENESTYSGSQARALSRTSHDDDGRTINHKLALRDWSEVMGLAAMTGLPSAAVMRASNRCADLFGQDMAFRRFGEMRVKKVSRADSRSWKYAYLESDTDPDAEIEATPKRRGILRANSQRQVQPQPQPRRFRSRSVAAPGSSRSTSTALPASSSAAAMDADLASNETQNASQRQRNLPQPGVGKGAHRKVDLICPVVKCPRHTNGFSRRWNLNQHMKIIHHVYSGRERSRSQSRPANVIDVD
ncbi:hypothetical protein N7492_009494 [Penicillium capsulatum]|uniref:Rrn9 domain-containing protein n=1 Tax=Penicillium capsulatum TaxID=69766 RepID=A0A9W9HSL4_9EURO|nr:hypothetical protein N7492_009494 [Penicillium capsulatum]KAJ6106884.1 hypothetical protein N7512_010401 [Penicillium capsulatum]